MAHSPRDAALLERGFHKLDLPEKPKAEVQTHISAQMKAAVSGLSRSSLWNSVRNNTQQPLKRTAYLDGLRGVAALLVYSLHHTAWNTSTTILENVFGWDKKYYFVCFPGIRILFSGGHLAVATFFVISGYVLSSQPLSLIHARDTAQLADNLRSALFRRWVRLFIPVLCTTFVWMTSWHALNIRSGNVFTVTPAKTYADEIWNWYCDFKNFSFIFTGEAVNHYNDHFWSIPMEFRGSIVIYTALLAFARCKRNVRLSCEVGLISYFLYIVDGWYCALFVMGMLLCDIDLLAANDQLPGIFSHLKPLQSWVYYALLLIGLYLGGVPSFTDDLNHLRRSPGWYLLSFLKPQAVYDFRWFYRFWAATFLMISIPRISWLKAFFETTFSQYLGRISYGLYLIHGPVLWTLGDRLYAATGRIREDHSAFVPGWINLFPFPSWGLFGLEINYLLPHLILLPFTLWLAEVVTKVFDEPSVKFSLWLFEKIAEPGETSEKSVKRTRDEQDDSLHRLA